jgi:site-specific recombinase XerD
MSDKRVREIFDIGDDIPSPVPLDSTNIRDDIDTQSRAEENDEHPAALYIASLSSKAGQRTQAQALNKMAEMLGYPDMLAVDWSKLRHQHTATLRTHLIELYAPATVNRFLAALRSVLKQAWRLGQMTAEDYHSATDLDSVDGETLPAGRELSHGEIAALMQDCDDGTKAGVRDAAIIGLLYAAGLKRAEIIALDIKDFDNGKLVIKGKRNKKRSVFVDDGALEALEDWVVIRGDSSGPLFIAFNKGDNIRVGRLSPQAIYGILRKRAEGANIQEFSPHDLRRTFISDLLEAGADISTVAKLAGHKDIRTTTRYDRRTDATKQKAAKLLHVPYRKRTKHTPV